MKHLVYIIAGTLFSAFCLPGCQNEYFPGEDGKLTIPGNGTDTTDIPEGHVLVSFVPEEQAQTRATTYDNSIFYVQALLYEGDDYIDGEVLLNHPEGSTQTGWPYNKTFQRPLKRGTEYTIVYLGNVAKTEEKSGSMVNTTEGLLSAEDKFSTARIHTREEGFKNTNMYYFFSEKFTTSAEPEVKKQDIPVMLRRLVSRHIVADAGNLSGDGSFYENLLQDGSPLGQQIFGHEASSEAKSLLWQMFHDKMMHDLIYPMAYALKKSNTWDDDNSLGQWWQQNGEDYGNKQYTNGELTAIDNNYKIYSGWLDPVNDTFNPIANGKREALLQLLDDMYSNKNSCIDNMLKRMKDQNIKEYLNQQNPQERGEPSFTIAKQKAIEQLKETLPKEKFFPFESITNVKVTLNKIPTVIGFDLEAKEEKQNVEKNIQLTDGNTGKSTVFDLLGTKSEGMTFGYSSFIANGKELGLPSDFPSKELSPNISTTYRIVADGTPQWNDEIDENNKTKIIISYGYIAEALLDHTTLAYEDLVEGESTDYFTPFRLVLASVYNIDLNKLKLGSTTATGPNYDSGVLYGSGYLQPCYIDFPTPKFGEDLGIEAKWEVE